MTRREFMRATALAGAGLCLGGCFRRGRPLASNGQNVVLVVVDSLRADHLGCYGSPLELTPHMDALAARGTCFLHAISCSPSTGPSHESLLTGTYQTRHRVMLNEGDMKQRFVTLAEAFQRADYETAAFVSNPVLSHKADLHVDRGFDVYDDEMPDLAENDRAYRSAPETLKVVRRWLQRKRRRPFFLWVHLMEPHGPYEVPDPALMEKVKSIRPLPTDPEKLEPLDVNGGRAGIPKYQVLGRERIPARYRARYAARTAYVDRYVGDLASAVRTGGGEDTHIALLADHGELLGEEHYYFQHGSTLLNAVLQVPLLIAGPGTAVGRSAGAVSNVDLMPTLLDLAGISWPDATQQMQGTSLAPRLRDGTAEDAAPRYAFCQNDRARAVMVGDHKYAIHEGHLGTRLTSLAADQQEKNDLTAQEPQVARDLRARLDAVLAEVPDLYDYGKEKKRSLSEDEKRRLRSLGYLK